jgi:ADP-ribosylglycohydrolase
MLSQSTLQTKNTNLSLILSQKTEAMFLGTAIGDALGLVVETKSNSYILQTHGRFKDYLDPCLN